MVFRYLRWRKLSWSRLISKKLKELLTVGLFCKVLNNFTTVLVSAYPNFQKVVQWLTQNILIFFLKSWIYFTRF